MPFRLQITYGERSLRIPLAEGELLVGSASEAEIRIPYPTVSRRHARLFVGEDGVEIEDLGSSNGTRIDGESVRGRTPVPPGKPLLFGTAVAVLESLRAQDSEIGIAMGDEWRASPGSLSGDEAHPAMTTLAPSVLESFTRVFLPGVLEVISGGSPALDRIQAIGQGLFSSLPCASVSISRDRDGEEGVIFEAERKRRREDNSELTPVEVGFEGWRFRVVFPVEKLARAYKPLVEVGAMLAGLVVCEDEGKGGASRHRIAAPAPPAPPSVSALIQKIYRSAARVAAGSISVLIRGESGTGKELLARYVHAASSRAEAPLVTLNCAALPRDLLEAELFGVEKGVATGVDSRPGRFEQAEGGTLFLDEIGDMAPDTQARILRVLQEKEVYRLGSGRPRRADVRVVSATNRDIDALLESGAFRPDLYHRIADWVVELPPLRKRREDIPNLAVHFLSRACAEAGVKPAGISKAALDVLAAAPWPGNIRQLEREMARVALFLEDGDLLESSLLQGSLFDGVQEGESGGSLRTQLEKAERIAIETALAAASGDVNAAARQLEVGRSTIYRRMTALGLAQK